jgi:hypothetical protein
MKGYLDLPIRGSKYFRVFGGPYRARPEAMVGLKMAVEINSPSDISIDTEDFDVPAFDALDCGLLKAVQSIAAGYPLYVGCMGGVGRTGLFLAILAKAWGIPQPVEYVRTQYIPHAVETQRQYKYVTDYYVPRDVVAAVQRAKTLGFLLSLLPNCLYPHCRTVVPPFAAREVLIIDKRRT